MLSYMYLKVALDSARRNLGGCLHDTSTTFFLVQVHFSSLLWLHIIHLYDTSTKCHAGTSQASVSSLSERARARFSFWNKNSFPCCVKAVKLFFCWESGMGSTCIVFDIQFSGAVLFYNYFVRFLHWIIGC